MPRPARFARSRPARISLPTILIAGFFLACNALAEPQANSRAAAAVPSVWQHHQEKFFFHGFMTARFSCDALEGEVRRILLFLGARADASVKADCPRGPYVPDENAWVSVDFYSLAPAAGSPGAGPTVQGRWVRTILEPQHPIFMQDGDCYLIEAMKPILTGGFTTNGQPVQFHTDCQPRTEILSSYDVEGELLSPQHPEVHKPELGNNSGKQP